MDLYYIYDEVGQSKVSTIFEAENKATALRYFKGFMQNHKLPIPPYELSLRHIGTLSGPSLYLPSSSYLGEAYPLEDGNNVEAKETEKHFKCSILCYGNCIDEQYNLCLPEHIREEKLKVEKNITEADFDEVQKNAD